jgi:hypothetical protein
MKRRRRRRVIQIFWRCLLVIIVDNIPPTMGPFNKEHSVHHSDFKPLHKIPGLQDAPSPVFYVFL